MPYGVQCLFTLTHRDDRANFVLPMSLCRSVAARQCDLRRRRGWTRVSLGYADLQTPGSWRPRADARGRLITNKRREPHAQNFFANADRPGQNSVGRDCLRR